MNDITNFPLEKQFCTPPYVWWDGLFSEEELNKLDECLLELKTTEGLVSGEIGEIFDKNDDSNIRRSDIMFFHRNEKTLWIFDKLNSLIKNINETYYGFDLIGYGGIQYAEYNEKNKGTYVLHMDTALRVSIDPNISLYSAMQRKLSVVMVLDDNSKYEGGEFVMKPGDAEPEKIEQKRGRIIMFPSFLLHGVQPVTKGIRRSLAIWVVGPKFK